MKTKSNMTVKDKEKKIKKLNSDNPWLKHFGFISIVNKINEIVNKLNKL